MTRRPTMRLLPILLPAALAAWPPASATPLCTSGKGLYTPCPNARAHGARSRPVGTMLPTVAPEVAVSKPAEEPRSASPAHASRIGTGRLCTGSGGRFTPCLRPKAPPQP